MTWPRRRRDLRSPQLHMVAASTAHRGSRSRADAAGTGCSSACPAKSGAQFPARRHAAHPTRGTGASRPTTAMPAGTNGPACPQPLSPGRTRLAEKSSRKGEPFSPAVKAGQPNQPAPFGSSTGERLSPTRGVPDRLGGQRRLALRCGHALPFPPSRAYETQ